MTNRRQPSQSNGFDFLRASRFRFFASMDCMRPQHVVWQVIGTIFLRELFFIFLDLGSNSGE
jgi:hypothetical protein